MKGINEIAIGLVALALSACVTPAQETERTSAHTRLIACYHYEAQRLDDGYSSAADVAAGVRARCLSERTAMVDAYTRGMSFEAKARFEGATERSRIEGSIEAVLAERGKKK